MSGISRYTSRVQGNFVVILQFVYSVSLFVFAFGERFPQVTDLYLTDRHIEFSNYCAVNSTTPVANKLLIQFKLI